MWFYFSLFLRRQTPFPSLHKRFKSSWMTKKIYIHFINLILHVEIETVLQLGFADILDEMKLCFFSFCTYEHRVGGLVYQIYLACSVRSDSRVILSFLYLKSESERMNASWLPPFVREDLSLLKVLNLILDQTLPSIDARVFFAHIMRCIMHANSNSIALRLTWRIFWKGQKCIETGRSIFQIGIVESMFVLSTHIHSRRAIQLTI